jgi:hypothetical protein
VSPKIGPVRLALGEDITMAQFLDMCSKALVGRLMGHLFSEKTLKEWARSNWTGHLGYVLEVKILAQGWLVFKFENP